MPLIIPGDPLNTNPDRDTLRDRIAEALMRWAERGNDPRYASMRRPETVRANAYSRADAVLAVLPDQAAGWLDAAAECNKAGSAYAGRGANDSASAAFALMETFLRKAAEAEYVATPCSGPVPCEDGGEPCDTHERLMGHAEGEHELCAPDCGEPWVRRLAAEAPTTTKPETTAEERVARVREWVTSDVVTARSGFGDGYREAQRDIRDLLDGRPLVDGDDQPEPAAGVGQDGGQPQEEHRD